MHELGIAQSILSSLEESLEPNDLKRVTSIHLKIGAMQAIQEDCLRFGFEVSTKGTPLENAKIEIEHIPAVGTCTECGQENQMQEPWLICTNCGGILKDVQGGEELLVEYVEIEDES
jgi:hydrogenase nickel incorporation protein HypA/HybF